MSGTSLQTIDADADVSMVFHRRREAARARIEAAGRAFRAERAAAFKTEEAERKRLVAAAAEAARVAREDQLAKLPVMPETPLSRRVADRQNAQRIRAEVAAASGLTLVKFDAHRRTNCILLPRQFAMWRIRKETALSLVRIAQMFGRSDHTTVIHAVCKIDAMMTAGTVPEHLLATIPSPAKDERRVQIREAAE